MSYYPEPHRSNSHSNSSNTYPPYAQGKAQGWYDDQTLTSTPTYKSTPSTLGYSKEDRDDYRVDLGRAGLRTPSPTPSELKEMKTGAIDWKLISTWRFWLRREWLCAFLFHRHLSFSYSRLCRVLCRTRYHNYHYRPRHHLPQRDCALVDSSDAVAIRVCIHLVLMIHLSICLRSLKFGWLVPIAVLFVISFPPVRHRLARIPILMTSTCSFLDTRLSPSYVGLSGVSGLGSGL